MEYLLLVVGFGMLIKGADVFVDGASGIAKYFKIPSILIGLIIIGFGTSAPEFAVNINASLIGSNGIVLGNIIGSSIFNISIVLGVLALLSPLKVPKEVIKKEYLYLIASTAILLLIATNGYSAGKMMLTRFDSMVLIATFVFFFFLSIKGALKDKEQNEEIDATDEEVNKKYLLKNTVFTLVGVAFVILGGDVVVGSSVTIAKSFGLSERIIGLTVVAIGTSLPELVTSIVALKKGESEMAIGNIIGSNMFNLLLVLGVSGIITPLAIDSVLVIDMAVLMGITSVAFIFSLYKLQISRLEGLLMILGYTAYSVSIIM